MASKTIGVAEQSDKKSESRLWEEKELWGPASAREIALAGRSSAPVAACTELQEQPDKQRGQEVVVVQRENDEPRGAERGFAPKLRRS